MGTIIIELINQQSLKALKQLEEQNLIRILPHVDPGNYALPGQPLTAEEFQHWAEQSEKSHTMNLADAKEAWEAKKKNLQEPAR
jgi:hypothetical protein